MGNGEWGQGAGEQERIRGRGGQGGQGEIIEQASSLSPPSSLSPLSFLYAPCPSAPLPLLLPHLSLSLYPLSSLKEWLVGILPICRSHYLTSL